MSDLLKQHRPAVAVINTAAYVHNLQRARELAGNSKIMAVIKADAYGHGMEAAADALQDADEFGVNSLDDVHRLRDHGVCKPLNILSANLNIEQLNGLGKLNVRCICFDFAQLSVFEMLDDSTDISVWIKIDTGMGRLGFAPEELGLVYNRLSVVTGIKDLSLMTHLANADVPAHPSNDRQVSDIRSLYDEYDFNDLSILNSAGLFTIPEATHSEVRPGLMLYGMSPVKGLSASDLDLKAVMTFSSELISVKRTKAGSPIGYGSTHITEVDTTIGIVAVGYGDGYPRHAPTGTPVMINGMLMPLIGRVSMDMIAVDLGDMSAQVGDKAILWGDENPIEEIAKAAGTIAYELSCGVLPRVQRIVT